MRFATIRGSGWRNRTVLQIDSKTLFSLSLEGHNNDQGFRTYLRTRQVSESPPLQVRYI
jgi:hypothetical protein